MPKNCPVNRHPAADLLTAEERAALRENASKFSPSTKTRRRGLYGAYPFSKIGHAPVESTHFGEIQCCPISFALLSGRFASELTKGQSWKSVVPIDSERTSNIPPFDAARLTTENRQRGDKHIPPPSEAAKRFARFMKCWDEGIYQPEDLVVLFGETEQESTNATNTSTE